MAYTRTQWEEAVTPLSAQNFNNIEDGIEELQNEKVDKASGKGLSTNDFTTAEKNKLAGIAAGAQVNPGNATTSAAGLMSASDKTKLNGIAAGAQVNPGNATPSAAGLMSAADKLKLIGIAAEAKNVGFSSFQKDNVILPAQGYANLVIRASVSDWDLVGISGWGLTNGSSNGYGAEYCGVSNLYVDTEEDGWIYATIYNWSPSNDAKVCLVVFGMYTR